MSDIAEEDEEFDPMTEDFKNLKFNSYKSGPGSYISPTLHTQNGWAEKGLTYKIFVSSIPLGVKKSGFVNIFSNFGVPLNTYLRIAKSGTCKFGFVEYRTLIEAQRAVYGVNDVPPLNLTVRFAVTDDAERNRNEIKFGNPVATLEEISQPNVKTSDNVKELGRGRGQLLMSFQGLKPKDMVSTYTWHTPYSSPYSEPVQSHPLGEFNTYIGDEILDTYHDALTYVKPVVTKNERYVVHMGRGFNFHRISKYTERYFTPKEKVFTYSNEEESVNYQSKPCSVCGEDASRICYHCRSWYCSKMCFRCDSPNHIINKSGMVLCYRLCDLQELKSNSKENLFLPKSNQNINKGVYVKKLIFPPLNYGTLDDSEGFVGGGIETRQKQANVIANRNSHLENKHYLRRSFPLQNIEKEFARNLVDPKTKDWKSDAASNLPVPANSILPPHVYTPVKICSAVSERCYWVNKMSNLGDVFNITKTLFNYCKSHKVKPLLDVDSSSDCAALIDGYWYRAKIIAHDSGSVKVNLIDYGYEETCSLQNLKILPQHKFDLPPLAFKIIFADGTPAKYQSLKDADEVSVKPVSVNDEGILIVQAENESYEDSASLTTPSSDDISVTCVEDDGPLPFSSYTDVIIAHVVSRSEFFVNLCSLWDELIEMSEILNVMGTKKSQISEPVLEEIYIKSYQNCWCRAKVMSLDPMRIFYIDYGNEEEIQIYNGELRALPSSMSTNRFLPMAFKIRLDERTSDVYLCSLQPSVKLSIKPISKEGETYIVVAEGGENSSSECNSDVEHPLSKTIHQDNLSHLLMAAEACTRFEITVNQVMSKDHVCGSLNLNPAFTHLTQKDIEREISNSYNLLTPQQVNVGDVVGCLTLDGVCTRGYIASIIEETRRVAHVDLGYVSIADKLCEVPSSLLKVPEAAVSCTFTQPHNGIIKVGCKLRCQGAKLIDNEIHCEVKEYGTCILSIWKPRIEDGGLPSIMIQSGSRVTISSYHSPQVFYVQSSEAKHKLLFDTLLQDVATYACSAPVLGREPEMDEVVACLFPEDQNFYRAQVYRRKGKLFSVFFLDFGNSYDVSPSDMRILSDSLKMVPACAVKVGLKGVSENIFTSEALHFLNLKCAEAESFYLEYDDSLKNAVLKTKDGLSLNNLINDMINPNWKKCLEQGADPTNGEVFFGYDIKYLEWDIKSKVKLIIIKKVSDNCYIVLNSQDGLLDFMRDWFTPRISEYCSSFDKQYQYTPRTRELCFVKMQDDDKWYRAVCSHVCEISCWVILVDFGNYGEVYFKNVRPMPFEFVQVPSILKRCIVSGIPEVLPNEDAKKRLSETLAIGSLHDAIIVEDENKGIVTAYFDQVAKIAPEIGLPVIKKPYSKR